MTINTSDLVGGGATKYSDLCMSLGMANLMYIKNTSNSKTALDNNSFRSFISSASTANPLWSDAQLQPAGNTNEQTIVDILGEGVLTNVISPFNSTVPIVTYIIRVTVDGGEPIEYTLTTKEVKQILMLGYVVNTDVSTATTSPTGYGSAVDAGFTGSSQLYTNILTPVAAVQESDQGLLFKKSLKVTIQASVPLEITLIPRAYVLYTNYIPKGL